MALHVVEPGLYTLLVDYGRPNSRSLGVPVGGAADRFALSIGNALVGNERDACALEISLAGPTLRAEEAVACVVCGAPFELESDRQKLRVGATFTLHADEELRIKGTPRGLRCYFCVAGGFQSHVALDSRSGLRPIDAGAELSCSTSVISHRFVRGNFEWNREPFVLHVSDGPQADWFSGRQLFNQQLTVLAASNRMGVRLSSAPLSFPDKELTSEPVCPGSVQVTRDGQCIVIGVDGQTIGGYPKIAQIVTADLDKLGQLRPDDVIRFRPVTLTGAERLYRRKQGELNEWLTRLQTAELFGP
jgi:antagonist of KipI